MWTNLLNNAAKYTKEGGHIWITANAVDGNVIVRVRDTGIGISQEMLPRIFDLFVQIEDSQDRSQGGMGIGLAIVGRVIEMHGGTVYAHSGGLGRGSEFVTSLPMLWETPTAPSARPEAIVPDVSVRRRILFVDDNVDLAETMAGLMRRYGHEVQIAHDGPTAIETTKTYQPEVVILDIGLQGMSGYDVAHQLRKQPAFEKVLLIAASGYADEPNRRLAHEAGFDEYLVKPFRSETLHKLLAPGNMGRQPTS